jgi:hypothetical protein
MSSRRWRLIMVTIEHAFIIKTMSKALREYHHDTIGADICVRAQTHSEYLLCCWLSSSSQNPLDYLLKNFILIESHRVKERRFISQSRRITVTWIAGVEAGFIIYLCGINLKHNLHYDVLIGIFCSFLVWFVTVNLDKV